MNLVAYFSGTGNSMYVAKEIAKHTNAEVINILEKNSFEQINQETKRLIIVCPMHHHGIPRAVKKWIGEPSNTNSEFVKLKVFYI